MGNTKIDDKLGDSGIVVTPRYDITSYGADFLVDGLVKRLRHGDILVPLFQRKFVWTYPQACKFIESLLLGLPIPGVFLSKDYKTEKLIVIDGQQRLRSLLFFYEGIFGPSGREFALRNVSKGYEGLTYKSLESEDRRRLDNSIIHATIVQQESPPGDDSSIYYIFERINTGGTPLSEQEIRMSIFHGEFSDLLNELNTFEPWRKVFGSVHKRMKDQELILRFLAFYYNEASYTRPLKEFLNIYMGRNRYIERRKREKHAETFRRTISFINKTLGSKAFRPERSFNAAVFDSVMVGVARRLEKEPIREKDRFIDAYQQLLKKEDFQEAVFTGTSDEKKVQTRMELAKKVFSQIG